MTSLAYLQIRDPTFELHLISVHLALQLLLFENLHLISRRGGAHPVMIGPMLIHQIKKFKQNCGSDNVFCSG